MTVHQFAKSIILVFMFITSSVVAQVRLPRLVSDGMVLQRDQKIRIWGWASNGEDVRVSFNGKRFRTKADNSGNWHVWLPPMKAGGPFTMEIRARNNAIIRDVLIGDVWLCSGQSNMVHYLELHRERYAKEIAEANYPEIRQFLIPTTPELTGERDTLAGGTWKPATQENIMRFSVVAYFFAKELYEKYRIPIGLINASVGGTPVEAWTSQEGLKEFPDLLKRIRTNMDTAYVNGLLRRIADQNRENAKRNDTDKGMKEPVKWFDMNHDAIDWLRISIPGYWEDQGARDLDGVVWYRREIDLPASMNGTAATLAMGRIVDADFVYVNGKLVGSTGYQYPQRRYAVPDNILKHGRNVIVARVLNYNGKGGFVPDKPYYLATGGDTVDLAGYWTYKVGAVFEPVQQVESFSSQNQPAALYNGMIAPWAGYPLTGIVWYQGESNVSRAGQYNALLSALIADWRAQWKQPDLPFLYVQLPNFLERNYLPSESDWALLREAQLKTLAVPKTAMVVALDLGEWNDIHPGNKKPVGDRLALAAMKLAYGEKNIVYSGPVLDSHQVSGQRIILSFSNTGSGLMAKGEGELCHFAIAGKDKKFVWANAVIRGNTVEVWSESVPEPLYVRYAWADNPACANLHNREGLPASPFRTDE